MKGIILGIIASLFFASTFVLNRAMDLGGGSWVWSAVLRYLFMLPILLIIVLIRGNLRGLILDMKHRPWPWLLWSTVGFGLFYAPVCFAGAYGPSWLVASTWQVTIIAGSLLVPFFYEEVETAGGVKRVRGKIPVRGLLISGFILLGVMLIQIEQANHTSVRELLLGVVPVLIGAFAYPLGNRKMMEICGRSLDTFQRVLGMTVASMPFWIAMAIYGLNKDGIPGQAQVFQSVIVAVCSGVIATVLFFRATDLTKGDVHKLAAVEATQSGEVIFALLGELIILKGSVPALLSFGGMVLVVLGMVLHSFASHRIEGVDAETNSLETMTH